MNTISSLAKFFDRQARFYDLTRRLALLYRNRAVQRLDLKPGNTVLYIGCGTGLNFRLLNKYLHGKGLIVGVDVSTGMLEKANEKIRKKGYSNVQLIQHDAATFVSPIEADAVFFADSLFVIPDFEKAIDNAVSKLKVGGKVVLIDFKTSERFAGKFLNRLWIKWSLRFCGDFSRKPWKILFTKLGNVEMLDLMFGFRYIAISEKKPDEETTRTSAEIWEPGNSLQNR